MADNAQIEIRLKLEQEVKQRNREQYESIFAGISRIQRDRNLVDFYDEADEIMHALDVPSSAMDLPPDPKIVARYTSMVRRVQGKMATSPQLPGAPGSQQQSNISPLSPAQHAALSAQLGQAGINVNPFGNFNAPMRGGAPGPAGRGRGVGQTGLPADIQQFAQQYQAELAQIGDEVFDRLEKQVLSNQMREAAIDRIRRIRDDASRQALRFPLSSPSRSAVRDIERGASEMQRRLSGQSSQLGFAGAEQVRYDQDVRAPLQDLIRQGVGGGAINRDALADAMRDAEVRRGDIRSNPNIDPSLARRRTEAMAQDMRQASQLARLFPEIVQRGTPGRDLASVSPGAVAGFENLQRIRSELQGAREGPMGQLASNRQRELLAELNINQQINRVEQERLRSEGLMTRERQHRFNVLQNEYRLTERDVQGAPRRITAGDISREVAMTGPQAMIGQAIQRIAFERGDVGQTGGLAAAGQLMQSGGLRGLLTGGMMYGGSRLALAGAGAVGMPTSGGTGALIGGLGAMAPVIGIGAVAGAAALVLSQVGQASQLGQGAVSLYRRGGARPGQELGADFMSPGAFMGDILNQGEGLGYNRDETLNVANILASRGGLFESGAGAIAGRTRGVLRAARYLGMNTQSVAQGFGTMEQMGLVGENPNRVSMDQFSDMLASSISKGRMRGREDELINSIATLTQSFAARGITTPEMTQQTMGLITALNASGVPGLRGQFGQQILGAMDQNITGARGIGQSLLYQFYAGQNGGRLGYGEFLEEQGKGLGSRFAMGGVAQAAALGGQDKTMRALGIVNEYFGGDLTKIGMAKEIDALQTSGQLTPEKLASYTQPGSTIGTEAIPGTGPEAGLQGAEKLADAQNKLTDRFQDFASAATPAITTMTEIAGGIMDTAKSMASFIEGDGLGGLFNKLRTDLINTLGNLKDSLLGAISPLGGNIVQGILNGLGALGNAIVNGIRGAMGLPPAEQAPNRFPPPLIVPPTPGTPGAAGPNWGTSPGPVGPPPAGAPSASAIPTTAARRIQPIPQVVGNWCSAYTLTAIYRAQTGKDVPESAVASALGLSNGGRDGLSWDMVPRALGILNEKFGTNLETNAARPDAYPSFSSITENARQGIPTLFSVNDANAPGLGFLGDHIVGVSGVDDQGRYIVFDSAHGARGTDQRAQDVPLTEPQLRGLIRGSGNVTSGTFTMRNFNAGATMVPSLPSAPAVGASGMPSAPSSMPPLDPNNMAASLVPYAQAAAQQIKELYGVDVPPEFLAGLALSEGAWTTDVGRVGNNLLDLVTPETDPSRYIQIPGNNRRFGRYSDPVAGLVGFGDFIFNGNIPGQAARPRSEGRRENSIYAQATRNFLQTGNVEDLVRDLLAQNYETGPAAPIWARNVITNTRAEAARYAASASQISEAAAAAAEPTPYELPTSITTFPNWGGPPEQYYDPNDNSPRNQPVIPMPPDPPPPPTVFPNWGDNGPQSYMPLGPDALSAIRVSFDSPTITLEWPDGAFAGRITLNPNTDAIDSNDRSAYRSMGYYGGSA